jgi:hypothetical protein
MSPNGLHFSVFDDAGIVGECTETILAAGNASSELRRVEARVLSWEPCTTALVVCSLNESFSVSCSLCFRPDNLHSFR